MCINSKQIFQLNSKSTAVNFSTKTFKKQSNVYVSRFFYFHILMEVSMMCRHKLHLYFIVHILLDQHIGNVLSWNCKLRTDSHGPIFPWSQVIHYQRSEKNKMMILIMPIHSDYECWRASLYCLRFKCACVGSLFQWKLWLIEMKSTGICNKCLMGSQHCQDNRCIR